VSGFSTKWLDLREPLDADARNSAIETVFVEALPAKQPVRLVDLASGTGSTVRMLSGKIGRPQIWTLLDRDPRLLQAAEERLATVEHCSVEVRQVDLALGDLVQFIEGYDAVTTSAFLDLVSEAFLERLVKAVSERRLPFLASLTYDGRSAADPSHALDAEVTAAMNRDQRTDKGFGPALGPDAAIRCRELFEEAGYRVLTGLSDWNVAPEATAFQSEYLRGLRQVASHSGLSEAMVTEWDEFRQYTITSGRSSMIIGHIDLLALPS